jgi:hypothetical protein
VCLRIQKSDECSHDCLLSCRPVSEPTRARFCTNRIRLCDQSYYYCLRAIPLCARHMCTSDCSTPISPPAAVRFRWTAKPVALVGVPLDQPELRQGVVSVALLQVPCLRHVRLMDTACSLLCGLFRVLLCGRRPLVVTPRGGPVTAPSCTGNHMFYPLSLAGHMHRTARRLVDVRFSGSTATELLQETSSTGWAYLPGSKPGVRQAHSPLPVPGCRCGAGSTGLSGFHGRGLNAHRLQLKKHQAVYSTLRDVGSARSARHLTLLEH